MAPLILNLGIGCRCGQLDTPDALLPEKNPDTHLIGVWVGPTAGQGIML